jgi:hypothetical protein
MLDDCDKVELVVVGRWKLTADFPECLGIGVVERVGRQPISGSTLEQG